MSRFKLVFVQDGVYAVQDTQDSANSTMGIEFLDKDEISHALALGLVIDGVSPIPGSRDFNYSEEFFMPMDEDSDEDIADEDEEEGWNDFSEVEDDSDEEEYDDLEYEDLEEDVEDYEDEEYEDEEVVEEIEDDWEDDWEDDDEDYLVQNDKFYKELSEALGNDQEKLALLSTYYMNRSQVLFANAVAGGSVSGRLRASSGAKTVRQQNKEQALNNLRGNTAIWTYVGFIDMGYLGGGFCTLGHALRYQHLAIDMNKVSKSDFIDLSLTADAGSVTAMFSANHSRITELEEQGALIRFGIQCLADFFEVDKETLTELKFLQNQAIDEMKELIEIHKQGREQQVKDSFYFFEEIVDTIIRKDIRAVALGTEGLLTAEEIALYTNFKKLGMIYPKSFVRDIREKLTGVPSKPFKRVDKALVYKGKYVDTEVLSKVFQKYLEAPYKGAMLTALISELDKEKPVMMRRSNYVESKLSLASMYIERAFMVEIMGYYRYHLQADEHHPRCVDDGGRSIEVSSYFECRDEGKHFDVRSVDVKTIPYSIQGIFLVNQLYELEEKRLKYRRELKAYTFDTVDGVCTPEEISATDYMISSPYKWRPSTFVSKANLSGDAQSLVGLLYPSAMTTSCTSINDVLEEYSWLNKDEIASAAVSENNTWCLAQAQNECDSRNAETRRRREEEERRREEEERRRREAEEKAARIREAERATFTEDFNKFSSENEAKHQSVAEAFVIQEGRIESIKNSIRAQIGSKSAKEIVDGMSPADVATLVRQVGNTPEFQVKIKTKIKNGLPLAIVETLENKKSISPTRNQLYYLVKAAVLICEGMGAKQPKLGVSDKKTGSKSKPVVVSFSEDKELEELVERLYQNIDALDNCTTQSKEYIEEMKTTIKYVRTHKCCSQSIRRVLDYAARLIGV